MTLGLSDRNTMHNLKDTLGNSQLRFVNGLKRII